ncbi:hypothetical protein J6590_090524 [Homalodisca vitripennis]|nr:hypothetical protein J6590_090524 [Homalodisca vitripennis]
MARRSAYCLQQAGLWSASGCSRGHCRISILIQGNALNMISDQMPQRFSIDKPFRIVIPSREAWSEGKKPLPPAELEWFRDSSKTKSGTDAGIVGLRHVGNRWFLWVLIPQSFDSSEKRYDTENKSCIPQGIQEWSNGIDPFFLPEGFNRFSSLDECKQQVNQAMHKEVQDKRQELESCEFVIENCLYLVWAHLDFYMLQAIPNKTLGIENVRARPQQLGEENWNFTVEQINKLKQGLISVFNDTFCKNLIAVTQDMSTNDRGFVEALIRRIKKLIQFVPNK